MVYASKKMPEAAKAYSITHLELCHLAINIASFVHLLKKVGIDGTVDHLALTHIHSTLHITKNMQRFCFFIGAFHQG